MEPFPGESDFFRHVFTAVARLVSHFFAARRRHWWLSRSDDTGLAVLDRWERAAATPGGEGMAPWAAGGSGRPCRPCRRRWASWCWTAGRGRRPRRWGGDGPAGRGRGRSCRPCRQRCTSRCLTAGRGRRPRPRAGDGPAGRARGWLCRPCRRRWASRCWTAGRGGGCHVGGEGMALQAGGADGLTMRAGGVGAAHAVLAADAVPRGA